MLTFKEHRCLIKFHNTKYLRPEVVLTENNHQNYKYIYKICFLSQYFATGPTTNIYQAHWKHISRAQQNIRLTGPGLQLLVISIFIIKFYNINLHLLEEIYIAYQFMMVIIRQTNLSELSLNYKFVVQVLISFDKML